MLLFDRVFVHLFSRIFNGYASGLSNLNRGFAHGLACFNEFLCGVFILSIGARVGVAGASSDAQRYGGSKGDEGTHDVPFQLRRGVRQDDLTTRKCSL